MRVLTADEMRRVDRRAIEELGIPGPVLMENAAVGLADALGDEFPQAQSVVILCGPGNNGGDGLALARHLEGRGYRCRTFLVVGSSLPGGDAKLQWDILEKSALEVTQVTAGDDLAPLLACCEHGDVVVDALFGTGLTRPLAGHFEVLVEALGSMSTPLLAVDIPSGLDGSSARIIGPHLRADVTVTFAAPKVAHVLEPAADYMGRLIVAGLGLPSFVLEEAPGDLHLIVASELSSFLATRPRSGHKGTFGHGLVVAGSAGKGGAAVLSCRGAVRSGVGLVTAAVPAPLLALVDGGSIESMTVPLTMAADGGWRVETVQEVLTAAAGKDAVVVGPGLGLTGETAAMVRHLVLQLLTPLVLDADGLNALAGLASGVSDGAVGGPATDEPATDAATAGLRSLRQRNDATLLTPHPGEMARLLGCTVAQVQEDRVGAVRRAAEESDAVVILKGHRSLIAEPGGGVWINPTGNSALATGGSGDVLSGILLGLLAQGYEVLAAAQLGVYLHGLAADLWVQGQAPECLRAGDLIDGLSAAFQELRRP